MADILASDLNNLITKAKNILGTGTASFGYGQTTLSNTVTAGQLIEANQWDAVRFDILNSYLHQTGSFPSITDVNPGNLIGQGASDPLVQYDYFADVITNNRFDVGNFGLAVSKGTATTSASWSTNAECEIIISFPTANDARHFFNSGSRIRIRSELILGGSPTAQDGSWRDILSNTGQVDFKGDIITVLGFYTLTNAYQEYFSASSSTPYSANQYVFSAKSNVADNSLGTANVVYIKVRLNDSYVDPGAPAPGDSVSGTLNIYVSEVTTASLLKPSDDPFTLVSPTYSLSAISTS